MSNADWLAVVIIVVSVADLWMYYRFSRRLERLERKLRG